MTQFEESFSGLFGIAVFSSGWGSLIAGLIGMFLLGVFAALLRMAIEKLGCLGSILVFGGFAVLLYASPVLSILIPGVPWFWFSLAIAVVFIIALPIALNFIKKKS